MTRINEQGYVEHSGSTVRVNTMHKCSWRDWFLAKYGSHGNLQLFLGTLTVPKRYLGKKLRFKVEIVE